MLSRLLVYSAPARASATANEPAAVTSAATASAGATASIGAAADGTSSYTVKSGDALALIAAEHGVGRDAVLSLKWFEH